MKWVCLWLLLAGGIASAHAGQTCWTLQPKLSHLTFVGDQAGAPANGEFKQFKVDFCFDPVAATGHLRVSIATASLETHNSRRDEVLKSKDFFAVKRHPTAVYAARQFTPAGDGKYTASGALTLKGVTRKVPVTFSFDTQPRHRAVVAGKVTLHRLDFGIGTGRWGNTRWVGNDVELTFELHFAPGPGS